MNLNALLLIGVFAVSLPSFTTFQTEKIHRLKNGNFHVPSGQLAKKDLVKLLKLNQVSSSESLVVSQASVGQYPGVLNIKAAKRVAEKSKVLILPKSVYKQQKFDEEASKSTEKIVLPIMKKYL